ncbi:response regulator [Candidatus Poribacteria bacterium]|nr:response regulator [Candidatus Poribacteria bacterium]
MREAASIRVLLVEDNPGDARLVREYLSESGITFSVEHVQRVSDAVSRLRSGGIDVTLLDLTLPDGLGIDTVVQVCAVDPTVPTVVMSGLEDETTIARAVEEGAQDYLIKGHVDAYLLSHAIRFAIERHRILAAQYVSRRDVGRLLNEQRMAALEAKVDRLVELIGENPQR